MDHSVSTPRTLWCLYKTLHYYPADNRNVLVEELLKKMFFKLFFSWSYNIRDLFYSLLLYQIEYSLVDKSSKDMGIELDFSF